MRRLILLLSLLACAVGVSPASAVEMPTFGRPFCEGITLRDYEAVLDRMPPLRHAPEDRDLPFGPRNMSIYQSALSRVIVGEGGFGYSFFDETYGRRKKGLRLDWDVKTTLSRVDRRGRALRRVAADDQHLALVDEMDEASFWLDTPAGPALYRYDIEFRDHATGKLLGSYAEYLRVVRPTFHAGIAVNLRQVRPGQEVFARVENRGTGWIEFGLPYAVERFEDGRWVEQDLGNGVWPMPAILMAGGGSGWCMRYRVPADASPGWYRFVKGLSLGDRGGRRAVAAFRVGA